MLVIVGIDCDPITNAYAGVSIIRSDGAPFAQSSNGDPIDDWANCVEVAFAWRAVIGISRSVDQFLQRSHGMYWIDDSARLRTSAIRVGAA